tara:strand:+ start:854 stop:1234 length:381 start_codon:yes stop_codon:yes gene_type:complete
MRNNAVALALSALLAVLAIVVVAIPFFRTPKKADTFNPQDAEALRSQRESIYQALETLRLERELGQVDDREYQRQLREYRRQAAIALRQQEQVEGDLDELAAMLEDEVLAARTRLQEGDDQPRADS